MFDGAIAASPLFLFLSNVLIWKCDRRLVDAPITRKLKGSGFNIDHRIASFNLRSLLGFIDLPTMPSKAIYADFKCVTGICSIFSGACAPVATAWTA
jgi:hypothetical protein